jgi:hypothetical protein
MLTINDWSNGLCWNTPGNILIPGHFHCSNILSVIYLSLSTALRHLGTRACMQARQNSGPARLSHRFVAVMRASSPSNLVPRRDPSVYQRDGNQRVPHQGYVVHPGFVISSLVFWLTCGQALSCNSKTSCFCWYGRAWSFFRVATYASDIWTKLRLKHKMLKKIICFFDKYLRVR